MAKLAGMRRREAPLVATVREKGRLTLPSEIRRDLDISPGDLLLFVPKNGAVELIPADLVTRDQIWFLSKKVQKRVEEAEADIALGKVRRTGRVRELTRIASEFEGW